jgi:hypothetical protein
VRFFLSGDEAMTATGLGIRRLVVAALALAFTPGIQAAGLDCANAPRQALPRLIARAMKTGSKQVLGDVPSEVNGGSAPALMSTYDDERPVLHFFEVLVSPGDTPAELKPDALLLGRMENSAGRRERWIFKTTLAGRLVAAAQVFDALDEHGNAVDGKEKFERRGPYEPRTAVALERELQRLCQSTFLRRMSSTPRSQDSASMAFS